MMVRRLQLFLLCGILQAVFACRASGDSPFAIGSFGIPVRQVDGRGMGMGGVSIALSDEGFSSLNPAMLTEFNRSAISGMVIPAYSFPRDTVTASTNRSYEFSYVKLVFPIPAKFVFSASLQQVLDFDWEVNRPFTFQGEELTETFRSSGAVFKGQFAIARPLFHELRGGVGFDFYRGKLSDVREMIFQGTFYNFGSAIDVRDEYSYETSALGISMGLLYVPHQRFATGFYFTPSFDLDLEEEFRTSSGTTIERSFGAGVPYSWGMGVSFRITNNLLLAFDYDRRNWSAFTIEGDGNQGYRDEITYALGMELSSSSRRVRSWLKKTSFRAGYRSRSLPMRVAGAGVGERVVTVGWGVPIGGGIGKVDIGVEMGSRGDLEENAIRERLLRFGIAISAFEKWIPIERRRRR